MVIVQFVDYPRDEFGPVATFDSVQLTYDELRNTETGDTFATLIHGAWVITDGTISVDRKTWSDIIIGSVDE